MKIATIIGARPQFIKAAPLSKAIIEWNKNRRDQTIGEIIIHTGQHFDQNMNDVFFDQMNIPSPKYNLNLSSLSHGQMIGRMIEALEEVLLKEQPDCVIVYGDTNSTLAGALSAKRHLFPVIHIEAGLRSFNFKMPEEQNRILCDRLSDLLFCPTIKSYEQLKKENIHNSPYKQKAYMVGDVMMDCLRIFDQESQSKSLFFEQHKELKNKTYTLTTIHRAENTNDKKKLAEIFETLKKLSQTLPIVIPLHPRTIHYLKKYNIDSSSLKIIDPVSYFDMLNLLRECKIVITDSGGLQKEAYYYKKPCLTLRDETEWTELVDHKVNWIVGCDQKHIQRIFNQIMNTETITFPPRLYGDGYASQRIIELIYTHFKKKKEPA